MSKFRLIAVMGVLALASCQMYPYEARRGLEGFNPDVVRKPEAFFPNVFVTETGHLTVDQEPIRVPKSAVGRDGRVTLSWSLAAGSPETFPANGVVIDAGPRSQVKFDCEVKGPAAKVYQCSFVPPAEKYRFKYTVYVKSGGKDEKGSRKDLIISLDPYIEGGY